MLFKRRSKWYGDSNGIRQNQVTYLTSGEISFQWNRGSKTIVHIDTLSPVGMGYELFTDQDIYGVIVKAIEDAKEDVSLGFVPVDVGRYAVILPPLGVAAAVGASLGTAFELDRIIGMEANAGGTSFITNPSSEIGSYNIGSPLINISANRSELGGAATNRWDDEGSPVRDGMLVSNGILNSVFMDRETSFHIDSQEKGVSGCSVGQDATFPPLIHPTNMILSGVEGVSGWSDMISSMERGVVFKHAGIGMDFQLTNGAISGDLYEVRGGKRTARIAGGGLWFKTSELWNNIEGLGSISQSKRLGMVSSKGEPKRGTEFSVTAPSALFKDMTIIDVARK